MLPRVAKPQKPPSLVIDRNGKNFRGAQVRGVDGNRVTLRLHIEQHQIAERTTTRDMFDGHLPSVGNPCYCEVDRTNDYAIVAVYPSAPVDHGLERAWEQDGFTFSPGKIHPKHGGNE